MNENKNLAIIGASYLQLPLIKKAKSMGIITHVFAWAADDVGEKEADYFYPISIIEKDEILNKCIDIGIDGICSIASDLAMITVNYVAEKMGLIGNSIRCTDVSTNKYLMRKCFLENNDPSPKYVLASTVSDYEKLSLNYPVIVKPTDRSGSRGITLLKSEEGLKDAVEFAKNQSFQKDALIEEYFEGKEYSVECISFQGIHTFLSLTEKYTSGSPHFIERGHIEPAYVSEELLYRVKKVVVSALTHLGVEYGASHSEIRISPKGEIKIIEIGARMGGDLIGSSLVELSTGFDFVGAVLKIALGEYPEINFSERGYAGVRYIFSKDDISVLTQLKINNPEILVEENIENITETKVSDSSNRFGYFIFASSDEKLVRKYLPM